MNSVESSIIYRSVSETPVEQAEDGALGGLTEQLIVLAVAGLVVAGVIALAAGLFSSSRSKKETTNLNALVTGIKDLYAGNSTYAGLTNQVAVQGKAVPSGMVNGLSLINTSWGSVVITTGGGRAFSIVFQNVDQAGCVELLKAAPVDTYFSIATSVGNSSIFPVPPPAVVSLCAVTTTSVTFSVKG
ncbi:MAG: type 4 pilus major pilin [Alphaproteobacteria bacterium]